MTKLYLPHCLIPLLWPWNIVKVIACNAKKDFQLYCPQGTKFTVPGETDHKNIASLNRLFEQHCQCDCCPYKRPWECSTPKWLRKVFSSLYNMEFACKIHDHCYQTKGRSQKSCDDEFYHNMKKLCRLNVLNLTFFVTGLVSCPAVSRYAYWAVKAQNQPMKRKWQTCPKRCDCRNKYSWTI